jgi:hypothetical protein
MKNYIATEAAIPLRAAPKESAEMVSQIVFGERVIATQEEGNWLYVKNEDDGYEGWLTAYMLSPISAEQGEAEMAKRFVTQQGFFLEEDNGGKLYLPVGASIPTGELWTKQGLLEIDGRSWALPDMTSLASGPNKDVIRTIQTFMNVPYLWGGRSSLGIDCSGLTQMAFRMCDVFLPRDSGQQWKEGTSISWENRQEGDLAFFSKENATKISHVGMIMGGEQIIHASGRVRIDDLSEAGIVQRTSKKLTHHLVGIKRYL